MLSMHCVYYMYYVDTAARQYTVWLKTECRGFETQNVEEVWYIQFVYIYAITVDDL